MFKYIVERTYDSKPDRLQRAFDNGYEFVRASEHIPETASRYGYIEYILRKEVQND